MGILAFILCAAGALLRLRTETLTVTYAEPVCLSCRYDLTGLGQSGVCPECGAVFPGTRQVPQQTVLEVHKDRLPAVLTSVALLVVVVNLPWTTASDGTPLAIPDVAWAWRMQFEDVPARTLDLLTRNRAHARAWAGEPTAATLVSALMAPMPLWAVFPKKRARVWLCMAHATAIVLGVLVWVLLQYP